MSATQTHASAHEHYGIILTLKQSMRFRCAILTRPDFPECDAVLDKRYKDKFQLCLNSVVLLNTRDLDAGEGFADIVDLVESHRDVKKMIRDGVLPAEEEWPTAKQPAAAHTTKKDKEHHHQHGRAYDEDEVVAREHAVHEAELEREREKRREAAEEAARAAERGAGTGAPQSGDEGEEAEGADAAEDEGQRQHKRMSKAEKWARKHEEQEVVKKAARAMDERAAAVLRRDEQVDDVDDL